MLFEDIFSADSAPGVLQLQPIIRNCSQFLQEAGNFPLLKNLSDQYPDVHRVKVRLQRKRDAVTETYDAAFGEDFPNLRARAVIASSSYTPAWTGQEPYYVFPVDGYKYLYSREVQDSGQSMSGLLEMMMDGDDRERSIETISYMLKTTYQQENLIEGMQLGSEIIVYNIPHFYAVKASSVKGYDRLISTIQRDL